MSKKLSHIGVAVENLDDAVRVFAQILDREPESYEEVADQKVKMAFFAAGDCRVELLEGTAPDSPITKYIERRGPGIHHLAVEVDDIDDELRQMKAAGIRLIDESPRIGAEDARIAFLHPKSTAGILIEFQQKAKKK
jgi:methylmalonyl-CoA/ethylmalonyl-CoA epimerase